MKVIEALRSNAQIVTGFLPAWVILSLPFALWVLSYLLCMKAIWWQSERRIGSFWFWCIPVISVVVELCQRQRVITGVYDSADLVAIGVVIVIGLLIPNVKKQKTGGQYDAREYE
ncbi:MAG: hypothetical protein AMXMBFR82_01560 [Candidatus Hydrogenedentota bacterium]